MSGQIALSVVLLGEARKLLSALRHNRRFGYLLSFTASSQPSEHPLVKEVKSLRDIVRNGSPTAPDPHHRSLWTQHALIPPEALLSALEPFLEVVKSRDASGIITGVALQSLDRITTRLLFLAHDHSMLQQFAPALIAIMDAAASCRFDATDPAGDEVVLSRIIRCITQIITSQALPFLSDASILRAVEACLGIAAGRRRASDLLKRTADAALVDMCNALGYALQSIAANSAHDPQSAVSNIPPVVADGVNGVVFGYALNTDAFSQHGPASVAVVAAMIELCSKMADPSVSSSEAERSLGLHLISSLLTSGGPKLKEQPSVKRFLVRDCSRCLLRTLGLFQTPTFIISSAFTIATELVYILEEDGTAFLLALLERVYPYYISGYENVLPKTTGESENSSPESNNGNSTENGAPPSGNAGTPDLKSVEIDPVIREIGLESLAALLATPGLLCAVYRAADCDLRSSDIVTPLIAVLGHASKTKRFRRRSKRLRASSSGSNRIASTVADVDSDEEDIMNIGNSTSLESSKFSRAAALLCAESILSVVDTIGDRLRLQPVDPADLSESDALTLRSCVQIRREKLRLQKAAEVFNSSDSLNKAKKLLPLLRDHGFAEVPKHAPATVDEELDDDVKAIVRFLRETPGLSKGKIGTILGEPDNLSRRVLADYTATFEFANRPFTESLRVFLESFRLPGESQKIDRIVQSFANRYFEQNKQDISTAETEASQDGQAEVRGEGAVAVASSNGNVALDKTNGTQADVSDGDVRAESVHDDRNRSVGVLKTADAAYVLSFSVVMLNTDQHNDSIRTKMVLDDFVRNCRGVNGGGDFPRWFLSDIFDSIAAVEIRMSDEAGIGALTDLLWDEQIKNMATSGGKLLKWSEARLFDQELFSLTWEAAVVSANAILNEAGDANSVQKALEGFLSVARCATSYKMSRPTDAVISSLTTATTLREGPLSGTIVRFGTDIKAQMAAVALSGVSRQCGDWLEAEGWQSLVAYLLRLHALCLLPVELEQQIGGYGGDLVGVEKEVLENSNLIPSWWPSQVDRRTDSERDGEKPKKAPRANGFFAAILAASIGSELDSDEDEDDEHYHATTADGRSIRRVSNVPPTYIKMRSPEDSEAQELARKCIAGCRIEDVIINEAKILRPTALENLSKAIARSAVRVMEAGKNADINDESTKALEEPPMVEDSVLAWSEIAPPSPRQDSSVIVGVTNMRRAGASSDRDVDFASFGLTPSYEVANREKDERKAREFVLAFCIDMLCELTLQNRDRLHIPWPALHGLIVKIIAPATQPSAVLERAVIALLRVGVRLLHRDAIRDDVLRGLNLLVRLSGETAEALSIPIASGVYNIVRSHGSNIHSTSGWHAILSIAESSARSNQTARGIGLETISCILTDQSAYDAISPETYAPLLDAILAFASCPSVDVSIRALELLYQLSRRIAKFSTETVFENKAVLGGSAAESEGKKSELWSEFWGPLFLGFASAVRDSRGKVRNSAIGVLERVLATGGSTEFLSAWQWSQALNTVLLPLMSQLFTTHGFLNATVEAERSAQKKLLDERKAAAALNRGRSRNFVISPEHDEQLLQSVVAACNRTRMKAVTLTSKTFLQHHASIAAGLNDEAFTELWLAILEVFRIAIESGRKMSTELRAANLEKRGGETDELVEHVPETVKNILLVMYDCGLLKLEHRVRWNATFAIVRRFLPDIEETISAAAQAPGSDKVTKGEIIEHVEVDANENVANSTGEEDRSLSSTLPSVSVTSST